MQCNLYNLGETELPESAVSIDTAQFLNSKIQSIAVYLRHTTGFQRSWKLFPTSESNSFLTQSGKSDVFLRYLIIPTNTSGELKIWILLSRPELIVILFNESLIVSLRWIAYRLNIRKGPINIFILLIFKHIFLWNCRLEFFRQGSIEISFVNIVLCKINFLCTQLTEKIAVPVFSYTSFQFLLVCL